MMTKITKTMMYKINLIVFFGLCLGFSSTLYGAQENDTFEEKKDELSLEPFDDVSSLDWSCSSIQDCEAVLCIIDCLKYWQKLNDVDELMNIFSYLSVSNNYRNIVAAYHHLLAEHLSTKNDKNEFKYINEKVRQALHCSFETCQIYTRNQRVRDKDKEELWEKLDKEGIFLRDLLDTIHAYLAHGYDSGHRYLNKDRGIEINNTDKNSKIHDCDIDGNNEETNSRFFDEELKNLKEWQSKIKNRKRNQDRSSKFQMKIDEIKKPADDKKISLSLLKEKFGDDEVLKIWIQYLLENECDTDNILEQIDVDENETVISIDKAIFSEIKKYIKEKQNENESVGEYSFGVRLYYWDYYKNRDVDWWVDYHTGEDLYVAPAYLSFKNEILAKGITINKWNQKMYEAQIILPQSKTLKTLKAGKALHLKYDISSNSGLSVWHILSILFYTNFTSLCADFSRSFRFSSHTESLKNLIKRNSKWCFLSKYLREVVGIFGEQIGYDDKEHKLAHKGSFYHGVTYLLFPSFSVHFYGPLSTSKQLEVAMLFTNNEGLIVQLKKGVGLGYNVLKFFNVSLLSCFSSEDERLFMGGYQPLQISSIRLLKQNINTQPLMHTLFVVHKMIKGEDLHDGKVISSDISIFKKLLSSPKDLPLYVQRIWTQFKNKQQIIKINMEYMYKHYTVFMPVLFSSDLKIKNLLLFNKIIRIFLNTTLIIFKKTDFIKWNEYKEWKYSPSIVCSNFIGGLKDMLSKIEQNKWSKLKKIIIQTGYYQIKDECNLYVKQFGALGWKIRKGNHTIVLIKESYNVIWKGVVCEGVIPKVSSIIGGKSSDDSKNLTFSISTISVFNKLISGAKDVPLHVQQIWNEFKNKQESIKIDMGYMYEYYTLFIPELFSSSIKNLLLFNKIIKIFPNTNEIICEKTDCIWWDKYKGWKYSSSIVSSNFIFGLRDMLSNIEQNKTNKLKKIIIKTRCYKIECDLFVEKFGLLGWRIRKENKKLIRKTEGIISLTKK